MSELTLRERLISSSLSMPGDPGELDGEVVNFNVCTEAAGRIAELEVQVEEGRCAKCGKRCPSCIGIHDVEEFYREEA